MLDDRIKEYFRNGARTPVNVTAREDYCLIVEFDNGEKRLYDMKNKLSGIFDVLKNISKFKEVFLDERKCIAWDIDSNVDSSTVWNNRIDICKDAVYLNGSPY